MECEGPSSISIDFVGSEPSHQILRLIGHFLANIRQAITPPSEGQTTEDHPRLTTQLLNTMVGSVFPLDQREGAIIRGAYEDESGSQFRLDFVRQNWRVVRHDPNGLPFCNPKGDLDSF